MTERDLRVAIYQANEKAVRHVVCRAGHRNPSGQSVESLTLCGRRLAHTFRSLVTQPVDVGAAIIGEGYCPWCQERLLNARDAFRLGEEGYR